MSRFAASGRWPGNTDELASTVAGWVAILHEPHDDVVLLRPRLSRHVPPQHRDGSIPHVPWYRFVPKNPTPVRRLADAEEAGPVA
jgi:hypothetical protein